MRYKSRQIYSKIPVALSIGIFLLVIAMTLIKVDITVRASGYLQIKDKNIIVEHQNGGRLEKLYVHEGQSVKKNQLLAVIDNSYISEEYNKGKNSVAALEMRKERLKAEISNADYIFNGDKVSPEYKFFLMENEYYHADKQNLEKELNVSKSVTDQKSAELLANKVKTDGLEKELEYDKKQVSMLTSLVKIGAASQATLLDKKADLQKTTNEINNAISDRDVENKELQKLQLDTEKLTKEYVIDKQNELLKVQDQLSEAQSVLVGASARKKQEEIFSSVNGEIQKLSKSHEGSVIAPGGELFEIAPDDVPVIVSVKLETKDRDKVWSGMEAKIDIIGLDKKSEHTLKGKVSVISADSFSDERNGHYYQLAVVFNKKDIKRKLYPGMAAEVYMPVGQRTIAEYLLKPLIHGVGNAFSEP